MISVCIAGATGWTGRALVDGVLDREPLGVPVHPSITLALDGVHVLIDYTSHHIVKENTLAAA